MLKFSNRDSRKRCDIRTPEQYFEPISSVSVSNSEEKFTPFSSVCIVEFEQVNIYWVIRQIFCTKSLVSF